MPIHSPPQRQDVTQAKKTSDTEEAGVPVPRNSFSSKPQNGVLPPAKLIPTTGFLSPKLPTKLGFLDDLSKRSKKQQQQPPLLPLKTSQDFSEAGSARGVMCKQSSWEDKGLSSSAQLPVTPARESEAKARGEGTELPSKDSSSLSSSSSTSSSSSSSSSPAHNSIKGLPQATMNGYCSSQETDCASRKSVSEDSKFAKLKSPLLANVTNLELGSTMSPPPAKKLALSARKVRLRGSPKLGKS